jgi:hypothetical protein
MRKPILRIALVLGCALVLTAIAATAPLVMRHWSAFDVARVEVIGARHLSPEAALAASGIKRTSSVFDDPVPWRDALVKHPLIADVRIERRVPDTIVLHITETVAVAFARTPELRAIDATGRILPADHSAADMDLPVLLLDSRIDANGRAVDAATLRVVAFLADVWRYEPGLMGWISEAGVYGDAVRLVLRNATDADALVPPAPSAERLRELHLTLSELATPDGARPDSAAADGRMVEPDLSRVRRIDVRFHDQIVVALHGGKS